MLICSGKVLLISKVDPPSSVVVKVGMSKSIFLIVIPVILTVTTKPIVLASNNLPASKSPTTDMSPSTITFFDMSI
ncbi:MAG: hypothetical protein BWY67_01189 [Bacteroidetes bacterium ADurb.Bin397]|nr:MAG: hypothetical protein BWY67_01189 [Bacteroidetes bacterium ADurb.Bin397]